MTATLTDMLTGSSLFGVPIRTSEYLSRGEVLHGKLGGDGRDSIHMHPHTFHCLRLHLEDGRAMNDPHLQLDAALAWSLERIDRAARAAEVHLDAMVLRMEHEADVRHLLRENAWCEPHEWIEDYLRHTIECEDCHLAMTCETAARLGVRW